MACKVYSIVYQYSILVLHMGPPQMGDPPNGWFIKEHLSING